MNQITTEALEFLNEAKEQFSKNSTYTTYRNKESSFIALRSGMFDDCIIVYELGSPVGNFTQQLERQNKVLVDYDDLQKLRDDAKIKTTDITIDTEEIEDVVKKVLNNRSVNLSKLTIQEVAHAVFDCLVEKKIVEEEV